MHYRQLRSQKGLSAIEFAVTIPLIFILMAAVIELGLALVQYQTLTKLVQNGARYGATEIYFEYGVNASAAQEKIRCVVVTGSTSDLTSGCGDSNNKPLEGLNEEDVMVTENGDYIQVRADFHYAPLTRSYSDYTINLTASATMRMTR